MNILEPANPSFPPVYLIGLDDDVVGGDEGISNRQAKQLVERTAYLNKEKTTFNDVRLLLEEQGFTADTVKALLEEQRKNNFMKDLFTNKNQTTPTLTN